MEFEIYKKKLFLVELKNRLKAQQDAAIIEESEPEGSGKIFKKKSEKKI